MWNSSQWNFCSAITISKKKWFYISIYRPPEANNLDSFFEELNTSLSKACCKYENFVIMGDFNIDVKRKGNGYRKLQEFCDMFNLTNLVDTESCVKNSHKSTIVLILRNKPNSFQKAMAIETGLSDFQKLVSTFFKSHYSRLKPKIVYYRNYKNFNNSNFLKDLSNNTLFLDSHDPNESYNFLTTKFQEPVNRHAPLKKKILRGSHAPFIEQRIQKSNNRLRSKFL